ncbi:MAG: porin PorA family protein [Dehalogenimonas sp.]|uniref:Porin PorA family protein n=1 Tax=Candidatus Dehalogenimonas loeffleri TaxID=3127115 RepID=A0ABZ2J1H0_9CHLR|nr:porin PorA family protein [Dehalogenimonas sp.]
MRRILVSLGAVLLVFALVWLYLIFPGMAKLPADYEKVYRFEGTVQVFNPATGTLVPINTKMDRTLNATEVNDNDALILQQVIKFTESTSGVPLSAINPALAALDSTETYAVDRTTRANVAGGDKSRSGQFTFPADTQQETYQFWSATTGSSLPATFVGEETINGVKVYVFKIDSKGNAYPNAANGAPQTVDVATTIKVEPVSGTPVYTTSKTTIIMQAGATTFIPVLINESTFTQATVDEAADEAASNRSLILWASVYGFWAAIGLGVILVLIGFLKKS